MIGSQPELKNRSVLLPALCCESMVRPFEVSKHKIKFYRLEDDFSADISSIKENIEMNDILLYMDYFGRKSIDGYELDSLKRNFNITLIEDQTHDFLSKKLESHADFVVCSLRKWLSLPDGAIVKSKTPIDETLLKHSNSNKFAELRRHAMNLKSEYLINKNPDFKVNFLRELGEATTMLDNFNDCHVMTTESEKVIKEFDFAAAFEKRKCNVRILSSCIKENDTLKKMPFDSISSSLYFPVFVADQKKAQISLSRKGVYCPVIWPVPKKNICKIADYTEIHMLGIPCDQRYNEEDMERISLILNYSPKGYNSG